MVKLSIAWIHNTALSSRSDTLRGLRPADGTLTEISSFLAAAGNEIAEAAPSQDAEIPECLHEVRVGERASQLSPTDPVGTADLPEPNDRLPKNELGSGCVFRFPVEPPHALFRPFGWQPDNE